jgi:hypothetical protein
MCGLQETEDHFDMIGERSRSRQGRGPVSALVKELKAK